MDLDNNENDPKYTLTDWEREEVRVLKNRCDTEGIGYRSIFELAKYVLVCSSMKNIKKRREDAFNRIKHRRKFENKHKLDEIDIFEAIEVLETNMPRWAIPCGKVQNKICLGYSSGSANPTFMNRNLSIMFKIEVQRFDLAAVNLEEARNGFYIVGTSRDLKASILGSMRVAVNMRCLFDKMHANRIKGVFYEVPKKIEVISNLFLKWLPKKLKERFHLKANLKDIEFFKEHEKEFEINIPNELGGSYNQNLDDWFRSRINERNDSDNLVQL